VVVHRSLVDVRIYDSSGLGLRYDRDEPGIEEQRALRSEALRAEVES
jgi:hypothetical protein